MNLTVEECVSYAQEVFSFFFLLFTVHTESCILFVHKPGVKTQTYIVCFFLTALRCNVRGQSAGGAAAIPSDSARRAQAQRFEEKTPY